MFVLHHGRHLSGSHVRLLSFPISVLQNVEHRLKCAARLPDIHSLCCPSSQDYCTTITITTTTTTIITTTTTTTITYNNNNNNNNDKARRTYFGKYDRKVQIVYHGKLRYMYL